MLPLLCPSSPRWPVCTFQKSLPNLMCQPPAPPAVGPTGVSRGRVGINLALTGWLPGPAHPGPKGSTIDVSRHPTLMCGNPTRTNAGRPLYPFWRPGYPGGVSASRAYWVRLTIEQPNAPPGQKEFPTLAELASHS